MQEFLQMGGYAFYVWSAFGLTTLILIGNWWLAKKHYANAALKARRRQLQHDKQSEVKS